MADSRSDVIPFRFGKALIELPKEDLENVWGRIKAAIDTYIEMEKQQKASQVNEKKM